MDNLKPILLNSFIVRNVSSFQSTLMGIFTEFNKYFYDFIISIKNLIFSVYAVRFYKASITTQKKVMPHIALFCQILRECAITFFLCGKTVLSCFDSSQQNLRFDSS